MDRPIGIARAFLPAGTDGGATDEKTDNDSPANMPLQPTSGDKGGQIRERTRSPLAAERQALGGQDESLAG